MQAAKILRAVAVVGTLAFGVNAQASIVIDTVPVGNVGNAGDVQSQGTFGAVDYTYNMGKYEVTAGQYRDFLNAVDPAGSNPYGLYNSSMNIDSWGCQITWNAGSSTYDFSGRPSGTEADWADRPVNFVSWGDSARFSNWMHNGQGSGDTETGSYFLNGAMSDAELLAITREPDATWVLPSEDEWYKAAYYKNDGVTGNYWDYPMGSSTVPNNGNPGGDTGNSANFYDGDYTIGSPYWRADIGYFGLSNSPHGTFDQGGNVWEWNEAILFGSTRGIRGGAYTGEALSLRAANRPGSYPSTENYHFGFRVAEVPEPTTMSLLMFGALGVVRARRHR